jgi:5-methylcytosine-specific restriction endonuclease McrA
VINRRAYLKKVGKLTRVSPLENTPERIAQRARDKANARCTRAKRARFDDEFTQLVTAECHDLRKRRNFATGFEWHVDHVIPLKGTKVSGLHIWSNLQVIPKTMNLQKGAIFCPI